MVPFSLNLTHKQTRSKKPDYIKIIPFSSKKCSEKAKKSNMKRKKNHLLPIGAHREKKSRSNSKGNRIRYPLWANILVISSLFSFAHLLIKRDTGSKIVPQSDSHKKNEIGKTVNEIYDSKMRPLEIYYLFPFIVTDKHTRSKNPTTSKLFHSRPKLRYPD